MQIMWRASAYVLCTIMVGVLVVSCLGADRGRAQDQLQPRQPAHNWQKDWNPSALFRASSRFVKNRLMPFRDFKKKFHKIYQSPSEELLRHALYTERLVQSAITFKKYINKQMSTYRSVSSRSDMTKEERQRMVANRPERIVTGEIMHDELASLSQDTLPMSVPNFNEAAASYLSSFFAKRRAKSPQINRTIDLRESQCFFPTQDQGACLSCASFVAIAQLEYLRCRETGTLEKFSEQFTLDCGEPFGMMGCSGTSVHSLFRFIAQVGLVNGTTYTYKGVKRRCPFYNRVMRSYKFEQADTLKLKHEGIIGAQMSQWSGLLEKKIPLHVGLSVNEDFEDYGGGVAGSCSYSKGAHGMLLVGEGRENGVDYWLLRNSYGSDWGEDGHYRMSKQATGCFSDDGMGYYPIVFTRTFGNSFTRSSD